MRLTLSQHNRRFLAFLLAALLWPAATAVAQPPRLVVLIVAEQFRADYLDRYANDFGDGGFRRLIAGGAAVPRMRYEHVTALAAPGAATLATGAYPASHGIVGDAWYDSASGKVTEAPGDRREPSPVHLAGSTLADEMALASEGRSRVVAVSGSAAPAIFLAGRRPQGVYWMGPEGKFVTSGYYRVRPPAWVREYNEAFDLKPAERKNWTALGTPSGSPPLRVLKPEDFLRVYRASPFAVDDLFDFAKTAVEKEQLGMRDFPDLLIVNLNATALLGLETGAYSPLMRDLAARLDRAIADFLSSLESSPGLRDVAVVFTGLHGIPPSADLAEAAGFRSGRVDSERVAKAMDNALDRPFRDDVFVRKYIYPFATLSAGYRNLDGARRVQAAHAAGEAARSVEGVAHYWAPEAASAGSRLARQFENSRYPGRSGDIMVSYEPYYTEDFGKGKGVAPGSPYSYDTETPLVLFGRWFLPGIVQGQVEATVVAPTLAAILQIAAPNLSTERPLYRALRPSEQQIGPPAP